MTPGIQVLPAHTQTEGGGFLVHRPFPGGHVALVDPFLLLDQMGPVDYAPGEAKGAPDHPHRGFETVTYMLEGRFEHHDSNGQHGVLKPGDVQWMTAGAGVVHSEMPERSFLESGGRMHGVQIWINLPAEDKMMRPRYQDIPADRIPQVDVPGGWVRILSGAFQGREAVIDTRIPIQYLHLHLDAGAAVDVEVPADHNALVYVLAGAAVARDTPVATHHMGLLEPGPVTVTAAEDGTDVLFLSGKPIGEPVARYGPFVMNTRDEIVQAVRDFQEGRFGTIEATMEHGEGKPYLPGRGDAPAA